MAICLKCDASNPEGANFCLNCGAALVNQRPGASTAPLPPAGRTGSLSAVTGMGGAIIMIFVTIGLAVVTSGIGLILTQIICIIWGMLAADRYNKGA